MMIKCEGCNGWIYELGEVPDDNACNCEEINLKYKIECLEKKLKYVEEARDAHFRMSRNWYKQLRYAIDLIEEFITKGKNTNNFIDGTCDAIDTAISTDYVLEDKDTREKFKLLLEQWLKIIVELDKKNDDK